MITCTKQLRHLLTALVLTLSALMPENAAAEKLLGLMCGKVYLSGGDVVELNDSYRIAIPVKKNSCAWLKTHILPVRKCLRESLRKQSTL